MSPEANLLEKESKEKKKPTEPFLSKRSETSISSADISILGSILLRQTFNELLI